MSILAENSLREYQQRQYRQYTMRTCLLGRQVERFLFGLILAFPVLSLAAYCRGIAAGPERTQKATSGSWNPTDVEIKPEVAWPAVTSCGGTFSWEALCASTSVKADDTIGQNWRASLRYCIRTAKACYVQCFEPECHSPS